MKSDIQSELVVKIGKSMSGFSGIHPTCHFDALQKRAVKGATEAAKWLEEVGE